MKIIGIDAYFDGGTVEVKTDIGIICIDYRIHSKTKEKLFREYPKDDNSNIIEENDELNELFSNCLVQFINDENNSYYELIKYFRKVIFDYLVKINKIHIVSRLDFINGK
jgi:hypothetical protein